MTGHTDNSPGLSSQRTDRKQRLERPETGRGKGQDGKKLRMVSITKVEKQETAGNTEGAAVGRAAGVAA